MKRLTGSVFAIHEVLFSIWKKQKVYIEEILRKSFDIEQRAVPYRKMTPIITYNYIFEAIFLDIALFGLLYRKYKSDHHRN